MGFLKKLLLFQCTFALKMYISFLQTTMEMQQYRDHPSLSGYKLLKPKSTCLRYDVVLLMITPTLKIPGSHRGRRVSKSSGCCCCSSGGVHSGETTGRFPSGRFPQSRCRESRSCNTEPIKTLILKLKSVAHYYFTKY